MRRALTPPPPTGTSTGAGNDTVADEDHLGFKSYVEAFAALISSPETKPPLTIGIFGSWGMGKSFLLRHIQARVCEVRPGDPKVHVVRFNAWEYSATDHVWPGLVRKIMETLEKEVPWPRWRRSWTRLKWNVPREWRRLRGPLVAAILVAAVAVVFASQRSRVTLSVVLSTIGALGVGGLIKASQDPLANWVTRLFSDTDYGRYVGYMGDIRHDLGLLEKRLHIKGVPDRILVAIDDLDRCEPDKAVEVLQAVNLLLDFETFIVCLGIDARLITGAIEAHYNGLLGKAGASGYEYLDKIVQIPFRIPEPGPEEVKRFVAVQLGNPVPPSDEPPPRRKCRPRTARRRRHRRPTGTRPRSRWPR